MNPDQALLILKIGGKLIEDDHQLDRLLGRFADLPGSKLLVHGGGKEAERLSRRLEIPARMKDGRRITNAETLKVVTMVYGGLLNKKLVSKLQAVGCNAIGLSGADGNTLLAHKRVGGDTDFGFVGDIDQVNAALISQLLKTRLTPVFCALTHDGKGQMLNTNADTIATELAIAMAVLTPVRLVYCFEKPGVLADPEDEQSVLSHLDSTQYEYLKQTGAVQAGMLPKLDNAFRALQHGVSRVQISGPEIFERENAGTVLSK